MTRTISRSIAVASAVAISAAALAVPASAQEDNGAARVITEGEYTWGFKDSFWKYFNNAHVAGKLTPAEGAAANEGILSFPVNAEESTISASGAGTIDLDGTLHFQGHPEADGTYVMDILLSDLEVQVDGTTATLVGDYTSVSKNDAGEPTSVTTDDAVFAVTTLPSAIDPSQDSYTGSGATVFGAGTPGAFGRAYSEGQEVAPANLNLTFADAETEGDKTQQDGPLQSSETEFNILGTIIAIILAIGGFAAAAGLIPGFTLPSFF